jgi:hypothetical protein
LYSFSIHLWHFSQKNKRNKPVWLIYQAIGGFWKNRPEMLSMYHSAYKNTNKLRDEEKLNKIVTIFLINTEDFNVIDNTQEIYGIGHRHSWLLKNIKFCFSHWNL